MSIICLYCKQPFVTQEIDTCTGETGGVSGVVALTSCGHLFHSGCFNASLQVNSLSTCPFPSCRSRGKTKSGLVPVCLISAGGSLPGSIDTVESLKVKTSKLELMVQHLLHENKQLKQQHNGSGTGTAGPNASEVSNNNSPKNKDDIMNLAYKMAKLDSDLGWNAGDKINLPLEKETVVLAWKGILNGNYMAAITYSHPLENLSMEHSSQVPFNCKPEYTRLVKMTQLAAMAKGSNHVPLSPTRGKSVSEPDLNMKINQVMKTPPKNSPNGGKTTPEKKKEKPLEKIDINLIPPAIKDGMLNIATGSPKGVELSQLNSAASVSFYVLFLGTNTFDQILLHAHKDDSHLMRQVRKTLLTQVVIPLRTEGFCGMSQGEAVVELLRNVNQSLGQTFLSVKEFLILLLERCLHVPKFLVTSHGTSTYFHHLLINRSDKSKAGILQDVLQQSFELHKQMKLLQTPKPSLIIEIQRMNEAPLHYTTIVPNLQLKLNQLPCANHNEHDDKWMLSSVICIHEQTHSVFVKCGAQSWVYYEPFTSQVMQIREMETWLNWLTDNPDKAHLQEEITPIIWRLITQSQMVIYTNKMQV